MKPLVVVGDAFLDADIEGTAERLCPDAPVPVVDVAREWERPGGAGLAAVLAARSAPQVRVVTALGEDPAGRRLADLLEREVGLTPMPLRGSTICKTRVRCAEQSLLRLDSGDGEAARDPLDSRVEETLRSAGTILVADHGHGVARHPGIRRLLAELAPHTPLVWDPHPRGTAPVPGARLATPSEAAARAFVIGDVPGTGVGVDTATATLARTLRHKWACDGVTVTEGARGAVFAGPHGNVLPIPVPRESRTRWQHGDTCGAGDRFASAAAAAVLRGASMPDAVAEAVEAAARFVAAGGAAALSAYEAVEGTAKTYRPGEPGLTAIEVASRVRRCGGRLVATGGCFDLLHPGHASLLRQARALGDALIVCLNSDRSVRGIKGPGRPLVPARDRARLLTALESVDAVAVFDEPTPAALLERLRPDVWVKGGDYAGTDIPEAEVVRRTGGEVVLVPTVSGYSTSRLVDAAHSSR